MRRVGCNWTGRDLEEFGFTKEDTGGSGKKLQDCGEGVDDTGDERARQEKCCGI
jgi:hypothetical protein